MSFILVPKCGDEIQVNGWNWRPTLALLRTCGLIDTEACEKMGCQGCGGRANADLASRIADVLTSQLVEMSPGQRMLLDLSITSDPKSGNLYAEDLYSATYEWLAQFRDFCRRSGGFEVF